MPLGRQALDAARRMTGGALLARAARKYPDRTGYIYLDRAYSYADADARVNQVAHALAARGVRRGDRVAVVMGNSMTTVELYFALFRLGAIVVPVNLRLVAPEVTFILADSGARVLVVDHPSAATAAKARAGVPTVEQCIVVGGPAEAGGPGALAWEEVVADGHTGGVSVDVDDHDPATIVYTSGTTGRPKGAVLTHFNLILSAMSAMVEQRISGNDEVWYGGLPLFHISGMGGLFPYLLAGGTTVIAPLGGFDPKTAVNELERYEITGACFVGPQWRAIVELPDVQDRSYALRRVIWGTSQAIMPIIDRIRVTFPRAEIYNFFGQTEMSPTTCVLKAADFEARRGSVGKPIVNVEARVVDELMNDVPQGSVGEIVYRGPTVMKEYWNMPEATDEVFRGGWFHSGDLCRQDEDGFLYVVDRKKDMIISGGENIYSAEVEAAILRHPKVRDVAVIGVPHDRWGETPRAVVVPADTGDPPTEADLVEHCKQQMASYKKPTSFVVLDGDLPRNAMGKVTKPVLRERYGTPAAG